MQLKAANAIVATVVLATAILLLTECSSQIATLSPEPQASPTSETRVHTETETPNPEVYNWQGSSLTLAVPLPDNLAEASIFEALPNREATLDSAQALADQFDMQGEIYATYGDLPDSSGFLIVDGNRRLLVLSEDNFVYYPGPFSYWIATGANDNPSNAEEQIADFLEANGFDADFQVNYSDVYSGYFALPLTDDGYPLRHNHFAANGLLFSFYQGEIASVTAGLLSYESIGSFAIISAEEALQKMLDPNPNFGIVEAGVSPMGGIDAWVREFPVDQTVTIYGWMSSAAGLDGGDSLVSLNGYSVTGNVANVPASMRDAFVEATGRFHAENGTDTFVLESWKLSYNEGVIGMLEIKDGQIVLVTQDQRELLMPDVPADVPLPLENVYVMGVVKGDTFDWSAFDLRMAGGGGGGGGGSMGLYQVDPSGNPEPLPTPPIPESAPPPIGLTLEGQQGMLNVYFYNQPDGSQRAEYLLFYIPEGGQYSIAMRLQGEGLDELLAFHNRPIQIWGVVVGQDERGMGIADVERYEIPYPELQIQILRGNQQKIEVGGRTAVLLVTAEGQTYLQLAPGGDLDGLVLGETGDEVLIEGLPIPDERFGGYPTVRVFSGSMAINPKDGEPMTLPITADEPIVMDQPMPSVQEYDLPTATIESIEMVYYLPDPRNISDGEPNYIQPMWRFAGHYSDRVEFEVMVQALQPEFLSPEIQELAGPG